MAGDRKEPGLGKSNPDTDADKTNAQDDFLDLIPERLAPRSRAPEATDDDPPLSAEPAGAPDANPAPRTDGPRASHDDETFDDDDYEDEDNRSGGSKGVMAAVVIGAVAAGIAGWYLFLREDQPQVAATTPVITADQQPYKVKPADPGGMDVPDTDKMVYDRLGQNTEGGEVENLLPEPETPTAPPAPAPADAGGTLEALPEAEVAATPEPEPISEPPADAAPAEPEEPAQAQAQPAQPTPTAKPEVPPAPTRQAAAEPEQSAPAVEPAASQPEPAQQQAATPAPVAPKSAASSGASGGGSQMVQLAALRDQAGAEAAWKKLQSANSDLLGNLSLDVQRADLGDKGIFYRVRAKGLASADEAKALCEKLKDRGQGCLVVR